ncbi:LysM peptidoglycan-binding domain-containing protein [Jingyaoa shaoxingensis]|uniref:LysM peptidoglycan-binding domain-containing protein n=1 Tax=Jingyaoa shaoxingensis TaxID=2763671 RepID=A0ABR7N811_9FIRM|nr:LysM peptidoglycan-binding domain-containing protein [Jingyaoa shaoxingensis]MBC8572529.1 LysM peptidoglycan-binding domain-containing protein [Jingyaoa shaoxingensis]
MSETEKEWKLPKNTRQIGEEIGEKRLYVEDYVVTYLNRLANEKDVARAILIGTVKEQNLYPYIFIDGAVEVEDYHMDEKQREEFEKKIEMEFGIRKIMGWFLSSKEGPVIYNQEVLDTYRQYFAEENQVLLVSDPLEEELNAFFMEDEMLTEQPGYQIYYEKNLPMQNRLIEKNIGKSREKGAENKDDAIHRFRELVKLKKTEKETEEEKKNGWLSYIASGFLVMTILALGVTIIYSYDRMKQVEQSLAILSNHVDSQKEYVTDQPESAEEVISHIKDVTEETETVSLEDITVEEETFTGATFWNQTEQEKTEPETEAVSEKETAAETESQDAQNTIGNVTARASYTVKMGDTLAGISQMYYGTTEKVQEICSLNGITDEDPILPGQKILLP